MCDCTWYIWLCINFFPWMGKWTLADCYLLLFFEQWVGIVDNAFCFQYQNEEDTIIWKWGRKGNYTTKSIYDHLTKDDAGRHYSTPGKPRFHTKLRFHLAIIKQCDSNKRQHEKKELEWQSIMHVLWSSWKCGSSIFSMFHSQMCWHRFLKTSQEMKIRRFSKICRWENRAIGRLELGRWSTESADGQDGPTRSVNGQAGQPNRSMVNLKDRPMGRKKTVVEKYAKGKMRWRQVNKRLTTGQDQF